jgi:hypothetical protein
MRVATSSRQQIEFLLARVKSLVPVDRDWKDYLRECFDAEILRSAPRVPMGIVPLSMLSATQVLASARTTVEIIDSPEAIAERPEGIVDLGTIEWVLRPSLPLIAGQIQVPSSPPWNVLDQNVVADLSKAVCRIDLAIDGHQPRQLGSGFLIGNIRPGQCVVMTNTHVVKAALSFGWERLDEIELIGDFEWSFTKSHNRRFTIAREYKAHSQYDLSLLTIETNSELISDWAEVLSVAAKGPNPVEGVGIGVIGHPSFDSTRDPFPRYFGFGDEFGIKRLSPGYIRATQSRLWGGIGVDLFLHDATTLSGSSGSCIVDLITKNVIGLHLGGWPMPRRGIKTSNGADVVAQLFEDNGAVPLWRLFDDPFCRDVRFS